MSVFIVPQKGSARHFVNRSCPVCRGAGYIEDEQGWCMYACCLNCGTETAHVSYKTPEERLEAARQAAYLWNIGKVIHNGMCD